MWKKISRWLLGLMIVSVAATVRLQPAQAQPDYSKLSDEELVKQFDRPGYKAEFQRRLADYGPEEQEEARRLFLERFKSTDAHDTATEDDLLAAVRNFGDTHQAFKALEELKARYAGANASDQAALYERLRAVYRATPYPFVISDVPASPDIVTHRDTYQGLTAVAKACLPEKSALKLLREVYLDSGQKGAITQFLLQIDGEPFTGQPTLEVLQELKARVRPYDRAKLDELGEHEALGSIITSKLRQCGDNGFDALKATPWQRSGVGIATMGSFKNPEARELLLTYYGTLPEKEYRQSGRRLEVLTALMNHWDRESDSDFRELLRTELAQILELNHNENPARLEITAQTIEATRDPWFLPLLKERRASLDLAEMRRVSTLPEEYREETLQSVQKYLDQAIATLEKEQLGGR